MKKAMSWLDEHDVTYTFHDFKKSGLDAKRLDAWLKQVGWDTLLNRRGLLWRKLPETVREAIDAQSARRLILDNPNIIKRPVLETTKHLEIGFNPETYARLFS